MASLSLDGINKIFGSSSEEGIVAVDNVNMEIKDGEIIVLVGPSGSGKSTILRLISGLEDLTDGTILLGNDDITNLPPKNRDIAMVFQNYALYPHLTARKNISFGLRMRGELQDEEINDRVENTATMMGIDNLLEKRPGELSGGQQQRVALGRAIVREPQAFLMDEPLSNLDAKLRATMRTEIQELQAELGITTIYVTHDQTEAMTMGDRIAIMNNSELQQIATPMEAYYMPANTFVAGFIGSPSMNFFDVSISYPGNEILLEHQSFSTTVSSAFDEERVEGYDEVILGIRPESIEISSGGEGFDVEIDVVEPLGKEKLVYFTLAGQTYIASLAGHHIINEGETLQIAFPEDQLHVFDPKSTNALVNQQPPAEDNLKLTEQGP